jgi:hypothetical protein
MDLARSGNGFEPERLLLFARRLRAARPEYRDFLDAVEEAIAANEDHKSQAWSERLARLTLLLDRAISGQGQDDALPALIGPLDLNPVFEDLMEGLMDRLALFPPHVNAPAIQRWERKNNHRILSLRGYVSDADALADYAKDFDWKFIKRGQGPALQIVVAPAPASEVRQVEASFHSGLAKTVRGTSERLQTIKSLLRQRVQIRSAGDLHQRCIRALRFDFVTRSRAAAGTRSEAQRDFPNAWIYELQPESHDGHSRFIGFLMDRDPASGYAVAMNREHVREWLKIVRAIWPDDSGTRRRIPARRSK